MNRSAGSSQCVSIPCPACGQMLVVPTADLRGSVQCPRCQNIYAIGTLIPAHTPIDALVVASPETPPPLNSAPQPPPIERLSQISAPPPAARPSSQPSVRQDGVMTQAVRMGELGTKGVSGFGHRLLDVADSIDRRMYGHRAKSITITAVLAVIAVYIDNLSWPTAPLLTTIFTFIFFTVVLTLSLARIASMRNDDGEWSLSLTMRRIGEFATEIGESLFSIFAMPFAQALKATGSAFLSMGMIGLALRNMLVLSEIVLVELFAQRFTAIQDVTQSMYLVGMLLMVVGAVLWSLGFISFKQSKQAQFAQPSADERNRLQSAVGALPPIIDCSDKKSLQNLAARAQHPVLSRLLVLLSEWRPRDFDYEDEYQASLHRWLRKRFPESNPERERPIGDRKKKGAGRADLVLSDAVLIEMKRGLSTSTAQKALGQIEMYTQSWKNGPVVLLICGTEPESGPLFLRSAMEKLHQQTAVLMLFAARPKR